jgi:hypothetical protein
MTDSIEKIGPFLGIAAFLGLVILAFLIFQQAREVRRLREWAGRAPERAGEAADASLAAAEARGEALEEEVAETRPEGGRFAGLRDRLGAGYDSLDRRMPFDPRYLFALLAAIVIAAAVLTSGFGLFGGDDGGGGKRGGQKQEAKKEQKIEVAVLNATQEESITGEPISAVDGLAGRVAEAVVRPAGFKVGVEDEAANGEDESVIMFDPESDDPEEVEKQADKLAAEASKQLGEMEVVPMVEAVRAVAKQAPIALVIGADNAEF